ncbi:MAG: hypothetical protein JST01_00170 [Cyanobacteria bacterium SZAS TMP-1]|nr:hypothetical protein [Cyanobacteria bacterium SZAS TMP-1]
MASIYEDTLNRTVPGEQGHINTFLSALGSPWETTGTRNGGALADAGAYFRLKGGEALGYLPAIQLLDNSVAPRLAMGDIRPGTTIPANIEVDGRHRAVDIHVPSSYDASKPTPVLYMLAGQAGAGDARGLIEKESGMSAIADQKNFIVVYPVPEAKPMGSTGLASWLPNVDSWNAPGASATEYKPGSNDYNYIRALTEALPAKFNVDKSRVGVAGFSEGGEFAQAVAAAIPNTFSSVVSDNGTRLGTEPVPGVGDKTSALIINGDHNDAFPLDGGTGILTMQLPKVAQSEPLKQKDVWLQADGIKPESASHSQLVGGKVDVTNYSNGKGVDVQIMVVKGGKNAWDGGNGGQGFWYYSGLGNVQNDVPVSNYTADFFLSHPKQK